MLRILAMEPYYGGSHRAFLDGYRAHSRHRVELWTMPARKWKWRMRGAALTFGERLACSAERFDALLVSDYVDLAALVGTRPARLAGIPRVAYFHENQLAYPVQHEDERDFQFAFTNITTCLAADRVLFNSRYHLESFLNGAVALLRRMPDHVPGWVPDGIRARAQVVPVGVDLASIDSARSLAQPRSGPLRVLWNHRWEHDKEPEEFFAVMAELHEAGHSFRLAVTGQAFAQVPGCFEEARRLLASHLDQFGFVESRADYCKVLLQSDVVVSTALQEFFGISVVEAAYAGCLPLLPDRLSYPELIGKDWRGLCLYRDRQDLKERLAGWMERPGQARAVHLSGQMRRFGWDVITPQLDAIMEGLCGERGHD